MSEEGAAKHLELTEVMRHLNSAFDTSDVATICRAIGEAAHLFNIADMARKAGVDRSSLYRTLRGDQSPNFSTVLAVLDAMNLQFKVVQRKGSRRAKAGKASA